ncbi:hypothetical protein MTO96_026954 [Rhipicephalus appendiculatus]
MASSSDTAGDAQCFSAASVEEGRRPTVAIQESVHPGATVSDGATPVPPWTGAEDSLPGCSRSSGKESQRGYGLWPAGGVFQTRPLQLDAETTSAAAASVRPGDGGIQRRPLACSICCFRRQLLEQKISKHHWWDPGPPTCDSSLFGVADVVT